MGWGISISQDENGFVYCDDANFTTGPEDYDECPPCSYDMIYEGVEDCHRDIDMARDEIGVHAACDQCYDAFQSAKRSWTHLGADEQWKIHSKWMAEKRKEIKECVVDNVRKKEKQEQIKFFKTRSGRVLEKLEADIEKLEAELAKKRKELEDTRKPLSILEEELAVITGPARIKKELQELVRKECEYFTQRR